MFTVLQILKNAGYPYQLYQQQYEDVMTRLKTSVHGKQILDSTLFTLIVPKQAYLTLLTTIPNYLFRLAMKLLNNTKARIEASSDTYPLYMVITDDYSKMFNIKSITLDTVRMAIDNLYTVTTIRAKLEELPVIIDHFSSYDDIAKSYPELLI